MSLINASLLFGMVLAALPVILHMIMRAKPKRIEFPALRLLKTRKISNSRRMQLRHLLLLMLRSLLIAVLVLAIARPSLPAAPRATRACVSSVNDSATIPLLECQRYAKTALHSARTHLGSKSDDRPERQ